MYKYVSPLLYKNDRIKTYTGFSCFTESNNLSQDMFCNSGHCPIITCFS